jgi:hypothetical protein
MQFITKQCGQMEDTEFVTNRRAWSLDSKERRKYLLETIVNPLKSEARLINI